MCNLMDLFWWEQLATTKERQEALVKKSQSWKAMERWEGNFILDIFHLGLEMRTGDKI